MALPHPLPEELDVHVVGMRRRHLRGVLRIEAQVAPRPWTSSLFLSELALRSSRAYFVARVGRDIVGYGGLMMTLDDGHVTTLAVDPRWHRHKIGTRLLLALAREAIARGATGLTLEVRLSNLGAQALYRRFGFEAGRRAHGLLRRDEGRRADHVGARSRPARVLAAARRARAQGSRLDHGGATALVVTLVVNRPGARNRDVV